MSDDFLSESEKGNYPSKLDSPTPTSKGVGGWLILFAISLVLLNPIVALISLMRGYEDVSKSFEQYPGLMVVTWIDTLASSLLIAYSIFAGVCLLAVRPGAVQVSKFFLVANLFYSVLAAIIPFLAGLPPTANGAMLAEGIKNIIRALIYFFIWNSYLKQSKRVQATYAQASKQESRLANILLIAFLLVCLLLLLATPFGVRSHTRSVIDSCQKNLIKIDAAKDEWALECRKTSNDIPSWSDLRPYFPDR